MYITIDIRVEGLEADAINTSSRADSSMFLVLRPFLVLFTNSWKYWGISNMHHPFGIFSRPNPELIYERMVTNARRIGVAI